MKTLLVISDSTCTTAISAARAVTAQFGKQQPELREYAQVTSDEAVQQILDQHVGPDVAAVYTVADAALARMLVEGLTARNISVVPLLEPLFSIVEGLTGTQRGERVGAQHQVDDAYLARMAAIEFAMRHDDGVNLETMHNADVILVGVSRTSKTPTCQYLAQKGKRSANIPLVHNFPFPAILDSSNCPPVICLTVNPERLAKVRESRVRVMGAAKVDGYADLERIREESFWVRREVARRGWPCINVTGRAVEETATEILRILEGLTA